MAGGRYARLPAGHPSLALGVTAAPGTLAVLGEAGGVLVPPGTRVPFGRNRGDVLVAVGEADRRVSRRHGVIEPGSGGWQVRATGRTPLRLPGSRLVSVGNGPAPLEPGYLPLFVRGSGVEHVVEVYIAGDGGSRQRPVPPLPATDRLVLTVLAQRYLRHDPVPGPVSRADAVAELTRLRPGVSWTLDGLSAIVAAAATGLDVGDTAEVPAALVEAAVLVPPDLALLRPAGPAHPVALPTLGG